MLMKLLGISSPKTEILKDPLAFLKKVVKRYLLRFPFQNVTSFGQWRPVDRFPVGLDEVMTANFRGCGGLCGHNNVGLMFQLNALGYQTQQYPGMFVRTGVPDSHCVFTVTLPATKTGTGTVTPPAAEGERYLVDVGIGIPLEEPINLEKLPYRGRGGGFNYHYKWRPKEEWGGAFPVLERVNEGGDAIIGPKPDDFISPQNYTVTLKPFQSFGDSKGPIAAVYENPYSVYLHQGLYAFRYLEIGEDDFKAVCVRGTEFIEMTKETRVVKKYSNYDDLFPLMRDLFPMIPEEEVRKTFLHFSMKFEDALQLKSIRKDYRIT